MIQKITDEEISDFVETCKNVRDSDSLADRILQRFGDRAKGSDGELDEDFRSRFIAVTKAQESRLKRRAFLLGLRIVLLLVLIGWLIKELISFVFQ